MCSLSSQELRAVLQDLHRGLTKWIPKRKETIVAMGEAANEIHEVSKDVNISKVVGSSIGIAGGVTGGLLGLAAILSTGGLATPFVVAGAVAGVAGVGGAITTGGAEIAKAIKLPKLMEEAQGKIDIEVDAYRSVILKLKVLYEEITDKTKLPVPSHTSDMIRAGVNVGRVVSTTIVNLLASYYNMCIHVAEIASVAAAEAAAAVAVKTSMDVGFVAMNKSATMVATKAAEKAATSTAVGMLLKGISKSTSKSIAEAAGKAAGEAAIQAARTASKEGVKAAAKAAARPAAKAAGKAAVKGAAKAVGEASGELAAQTAGKAAGIAGKVAGPTIVKGVVKALPLLNFGFAAWDTYETVSASMELYAGPEEERILRDKMEKLKDEANEVVINIYNYFAADETLKLPLIDVPFPECKI